MPETEERSSNGWTISTLRLYFEKSLLSSQEDFTNQIKNLKELFQERNNAGTKAIDAAFAAQQLATTSALATTKEANLKSEVNAEKRFDSFRTETVALFNSLSDKLSAEVSNITKQINTLTTQLSGIQGQDTGSTTTRNTTRMDNSQLIGIGGLFLALISVATAIIVLFAQ